MWRRSPVNGQQWLLQRSNDQVSGLNRNWVHAMSHPTSQHVTLIYFKQVYLIIIATKDWWRTLLVLAWNPFQETMLVATSVFGWRLPWKRFTQLPGVALMCWINHCIMPQSFVSRLLLRQKLWLKVCPLTTLAWAPLPLPLRVLLLQRLTSWFTALPLLRVPVPWQITIYLYSAASLACLRISHDLLTSLCNKLRYKISLKIAGDGARSEWFSDPAWAFLASAFLITQTDDWLFWNAAIILDCFNLSQTLAASG